MWIFWWLLGVLLILLALSLRRGKSAATAKQQLLEPERQAKREARLAEEKAKNEAEKRERDAEMEKQRESVTKKMKPTSSGDCSLIFSSSEAFIAETDFKYMPVAQEVWSCGLGTWGDEEHKHTTSAADRADLSQVAQQITETLKNVAFPSSEGGEPIVGFVISKDLPAVRELGEDATTSQIIEAAFTLPGEEYGDFDDGLPVAEESFPRFEDFEDERAEKVKSAMQLLISRCAEDSLTSYFAHSDNYVGPLIVACKTKTGDVLGITGWLVWT